MKKALYCLFAQFGKIMDIVAVRRNQLRGQAWIVFADLNSAINAMKTMQGFPFFDKPIKLFYARAKSQLVAQIDGTYNPNKNKEKHIMPNIMENTTAKIEARTRISNEAIVKSSTHMVGNHVQNKMLFVDNPPPASTTEMLTMLFQQFTGFI